VARGVSLHIGLNRLDPTHYQGWSDDDELSGCEQDAHDMASLADKRKFDATELLEESATSSAVRSFLAASAGALVQGDIFLITFSGHGGRLPDSSGDESPNGQDSTWCLFNRELRDDELFEAWSWFRSGVRLVLISDSCHSGSIEKLDAAPADIGRGRVKSLPRRVASQTYRANRALYDSIIGASAGATGSFAASLIGMSACADDQTTSDGDPNSAFTAALLRDWEEGSFTGSYSDLLAAVARRLPSQDPAYLVLGAPYPGFESESAFAI
jgi:hypothetical protein